MLLSATQNRGGLLGAAAGAVVGLAFLPSRHRLRLIVRAIAVIVMGLVVAAQLSLQHPDIGASDQGRAFSASQFINNVLSIEANAGRQPRGTVAARDLLWGLVYKSRCPTVSSSTGTDSVLTFPISWAMTQVTSGTDPLRSPHNSHDDILARLGLIGISLWIALWLGWYWRMVVGCRRLARRGMHIRRQVGVSA